MIKGSGIRCKGNLEAGEFELVPVRLLNKYLKLGLFNGNHIAVFMYLLANDNEGYGYAWPTVNDMAIELGLAPKTVKSITKRLEEAGLIRKEKNPNYTNKNNYYVYKPLKDIEAHVPKEVIEKAKIRIEKIKTEGFEEKEKLANHLEEKAIIERKLSERKVNPANTNNKQPKENNNPNKQLEEQIDREMIEKLARL